MENTAENKKKEEINVGDYVKVVGNLYTDSCDDLDINIYGTIAQVMYKFNDNEPQSTCVIRLSQSTKNLKRQEMVVSEKFLEKVDLDDETRKFMFGVDVIDENACKKMHDFCYGKDVFKDIMPLFEKEADFERITSEMRELYMQKNHDYGNSFGRSFQKYGLISAITRMSDKWERIDSLTQKQAEVKDESIRDTLIDLANYCVMTVMELDKNQPNAKQEETFITRLEKEWQELNERIKKLSAFLKSKKVDSVSKFQKELMDEQITHMRAYRDALEMRKEDILQKLEAESEQKES